MKNIFMCCYYWSYYYRLQFIFVLCVQYRGNAI